MGKIYLITGGAGFIGANLVRLLMARGKKVRVLDNLSTGRIEDLEDLPVEIIIGDIRDERSVDEAVAGVEAVIHLAGHTNVVESVREPALDLDINVQGTFNVLMSGARHKVERVIFASTGGAVLGDITPPAREDMAPHPISFYGASKLAGEGYCSAFWGSYGLKTVFLRFSNIYGPFSHNKGSVVPNFFRQIQAGRELIIFGDGGQTRDFLYVGDLCQGIATALEADLPFGQAIQLGAGQETSINHLLSLIRQLVGEDFFPQVVHQPARAGEVRRSFVSIAQAQKYLNFSVPTALLEGLRQTWEWFQQNQGDTEWPKRLEGFAVNEGIYKGSG